MSTMVIQYLMHVRLADEVSDLKLEVQMLKLKSQNSLPTMKWEPFKRQKRQVGGDIKTAEKSGVNVLDYAYQYGVDLKTESKLAVYPTLMGELDDSQSNFGGSNSGQNQNNPYGDHNQLGILRESSSQGSSNNQPPQSAYSRVNRNADPPCSKYGPDVQKRLGHKLCQMKRVNPRTSAHRHSRVAVTPEVTTQAYVVPDPVPSPRPVPKSMLKSLDDGPNTFDTIGSPILSVHLQARHSFDESSTDLKTGFHNSWRLSPWSKKMHGAKLFSIDEENGQIEVPENGLYLVYAQIEYMDVNETNGFEVDLDSEAILSCVVTTSGSDDDKKKHNTCFTSGAIFLQRGALLNVRDKEVGRLSLLHSKGSFFGITKISSC